MSPYSGLLGGAVTDDSDFTHRLQRMRPATDRADPGMVVQSSVDPGYAMPNVDQGNLNQTPGQEVGGTLPAGLPEDAKRLLLLRALQALAST